MFRIALLVLFFVAGCGREPRIEIRDDEVSWKQLLSNAAQLGIQPFSETRLFSSSSGPVSLAGYAPVKFGDLDHGSFLEVNEVEGGYEAVLAEASGPGAVTWIHSANPVGLLHIEIDGRRSVLSARTFFSGEWLPARGPFAVETAGGFNVHFPFVHRHQMKVSVQVESKEELGSLFYQIAWNRIHSPKKIVPFDLLGLSGEKELMKQLAADWKRGDVPSRRVVGSTSLRPGKTAIMLSATGKNCIQGLGIAAKSKAQLGQLGIELIWDDRPALECPLNMLCGVSSAFGNVDSVPVQVRGSSVLIRWPMPFERSAKIRLINQGSEEVEVALSAAYGSSERQEHFCGTFARFNNLETDSYRVLTLADIPGSGRVVGCMVQVENHSGRWWGEGDPVIYLNGDPAPAWRGTGTEDYFGYAWSSNDRFQHPLRGQTKAGVLYRYHLLDTIPFTRGARFDFEAQGLGGGLMDYSALVLWYDETSSTN